MSKKHIFKEGTEYFEDHYITTVLDINPSGTTIGAVSRTIYYNDKTYKYEYYVNYDEFIYELYYNENGEYHRENGHAYIDNTGIKYYFINGKDITDLVEKHPNILTDKTLRKILL